MTAISWLEILGMTPSYGSLTILLTPAPSPSLNRFPTSPLHTLVIWSCFRGLFVSRAQRERTSDMPCYNLHRILSTLQRWSPPREGRASFDICSILFWVRSRNRSKQKLIRLCIVLFLETVLQFFGVFGKRLREKGRTIKDRWKESISTYLCTYKYMYIFTCLLLFRLFGMFQFNRKSRNWLSQLLNRNTVS